MHEGKYIFAQINEFVSQYEFDKCVQRYNGNYKVKHFTCWSQFLCMSFGQLTYRESLRDVIICLKSQQKKLYHIGINSNVDRSTLAKANENRDWRIYADFAQILIKEARELYIDDTEFKFELDNTVYALDSTTIDLCLSVFWWAKFRKYKAAIKLHTLLDLRGSIPTFIHITDGKVHDVNVLDIIEFELGAFYVMDKAYIDFERLYKITEVPAFFVTRAKDNLRFKRIYSNKVDKTTGLRCDQIIKLITRKSAREYPEKLRRIKYYDIENDQLYVFLTNNFEISTLSVAMLYKYRWMVELFFKWIKQHLRIKVFWGESENAVKTQIWIAVATYVLVAIVKKKLKIKHSLYEMLQILSVSTFDKTPINELFNKEELRKLDTAICKQLKLFDL
jgi:hypothetical protein